MRRRAQIAGAGGCAARRPAWSRRHRGRRSLAGGRGGGELRPRPGDPAPHPRPAPERPAPLPTAPASAAGLTQAVEAERAVVQEVADVTRAG